MYLLINQNEEEKKRDLSDLFCWSNIFIKLIKNKKNSQIWIYTEKQTSRFGFYLVTLGLYLADLSGKSKTLNGISNGAAFL